MATNRLLIVATLVILFLQIGCKQATEPPPPVTKPLVADAGPDQTVNVGNYVVLDGSKSTGGNGDTLLYHWSYLGPRQTVFIATDDRIKPIVGFARTGTYKFTLTVGDGQQNSPPDTCTVSVLPRNPGLIQDVCLELMIRIDLQKPVGEITDQDLVSLTIIHDNNFFYDTLRTLQGLERCTNVIELDLSIGRVQNLSPLSGLKKLKTLKLDQHLVLSDLSPLSGLTQLEQLYLQVNNITDVSPLAGLTNLTYLQLMANKVTNMEALANLTALQELYTSNSTVKNLNFVSSLKNLQTLWMTDGQIVDISGVSALTNLKRLQLENNQIVDVTSLSNLVGLSLIYLARNDIADISSLQYLANASDVTLDGNQIVDLLPLVNNSGLGNGDILTLTALPLSAKSINEYIPALQARGVNIIRLFKK